MLRNFPLRNLRMLTKLSEQICAIFEELSLSLVTSVQLPPLRSPPVHWHPHNALKSPSAMHGSWQSGCGVIRRHNAPDRLIQQQTQQLQMQQFLADFSVFLAPDLTNTAKASITKIEAGIVISFFSAHLDNNLVYKVYFTNHFLLHVQFCWAQIPISENFTKIPRSFWDHLTNAMNKYLGPR